MCNACAYLCCASDEFEACGCDHCPESACHYWPDDDEFDFGDEMPGDEDDGGVLMPLVACGCAAVGRRFQCEAVQP